MNDTPQQSLITAEQINQVVKAFYAKIRVHPALGPIFSGIIGNIGDNTALWELHEDKIGRFWRTVLLREGSYFGNPMLVHIDVPDIKDEHFTQWLALFDTVLYKELPEEAAAKFSNKAHQIGGSLRRSVHMLNG